MLQDTIILERCPCCNKPTKKISLREAQENYFNTQREKDVLVFHGNCKDSRIAGALTIKEGTADHERDMMILKQLYFGNHLEDSELERAHKLVYLLEIELKQRRF